MNANFTEAAQADTTAQEKPVKRLRRGDVREDGKVFWAYAPDCVNGEYWTTPEEFTAKKAAKKAKEAEKKAVLSAKKGTLQTKLRRGDTREDGTVFWCYGPNYANGEYWLTPEEFAASKATEKARQAEKQAELAVKKAALPTKLRCGDTREDGTVFWCYGPNYEDGERWMTPEQFSEEKAKEAKKRADLSAKKAASPTKLRRGDTREDGKIFWRYKPSCANGEYWLTPEEFVAKQTKRNARNRERRATDPLFALKCRLRDRVSSALRRKGFKKNTKTALLLGCTYEELKVHTEARLPLGMTWELFLSDGHLDHIVPLDVADTEEDVYSLNHFTNLRPMWGSENQSKSSKLPEEHELPANLHPKVKEIYLTAKARSA